MRKVTDQELDKLFQEAADNVRPEFDPADWQQLSNRLDAEVRGHASRSATLYSMVALLLISSLWSAWTSTPSISTSYIAVKRNDTSVVQNAAADPSLSSSPKSVTPVAEVSDRAMEADGSGQQKFLSFIEDTDGGKKNDQGATVAEYNENQQSKIADGITDNKMNGKAAIANASSHTSSIGKTRQQSKISSSQVKQAAQSNSDVVDLSRKKNTTVPSGKDTGSSSAHRSNTPEAASTFNDETNTSPIRLQSTEELVEDNHASQNTIRGRHESDNVHQFFSGNDATNSSLKQDTKIANRLRPSVDNAAIVRSENVATHPSINDNDQYDTQIVPTQNVKESTERNVLAVKSSVGKSNDQMVSGTAKVSTSGHAILQTTMSEKGKTSALPIARRRATLIADSINMPDKLLITHNVPVTKKFLEDTARRAEPSDDKKLHGWSLKLPISPDFSSIDYGKAGKTGVNIGLMVEYHITSHLSASTGAIWSKKLYDTKDPGTYYSWGSNTAEVNTLTGDCRVLDIPVNITYYIMPSARTNFFVTVGASSYIMLNEKYGYTVTANQKDYYYEDNFKNKNRNWFSMLNISFGLQHRINSRFYLQAEPFLKAPIAGVGEGKVNLSTAGVFVSLKYKIR